MRTHSIATLGLAEQYGDLSLTQMSHTLQEEPSSSACDDLAFEVAVLSSDKVLRVSHKRTRQQHQRVTALLKKQKGMAFPFHEPVDVLNGCLAAAAAVTGATAPNFNLESDPRQVYFWVAKTLINYGKECREEGTHLQQQNRLLLPPQLAKSMLDCTTKMNTLLSGVPHDPAHPV